MPRTTLAQAGEHAVIAAITNHCPSALNGDDAAVLAHPAPNTRTVVSTDLLIENRHFRRDWSTMNHVGQKAITQNFADIESMGARPIAALLGLSAPGHMLLRDIIDFAEGLSARLETYGASLVGGDITTSDSVMVSITAIGALGGSLPATTLDGARAGQKVVATGVLGESAAGLALLTALGPGNIPDRLMPLVQAHQATIVPQGRGYIARSAGVTAMTDISDGLVVDVHTMAKRSDVHIDLWEDTLAPHSLMLEAATLLGVDPWEWVLSGGEDHALVGTTDSPVPSGFRQVGTVGKTNGHRVTVGGQLPAYTTGWESL